MNFDFQRVHEAFSELPKREDKVSFVRRALASRFEKLAKDVKDGKSDVNQRELIAGACTFVKDMVQVTFEGLCIDCRKPMLEDVNAIFEGSHVPRTDGKSSSNGENGTGDFIRHLFESFLAAQEEREVESLLEKNGGLANFMEKKLAKNLPPHVKVSFIEIARERQPDTGEQNPDKRGGQA